MERWSGILKIQLHPDSSTFYRVAASLGLSSSSKKLAVCVFDLITVLHETTATKKEKRLCLFSDICEYVPQVLL